MLTRYNRPVSPATQTRRELNESIQLVESAIEIAENEGIEN